MIGSSCGESGVKKEDLVSFKRSDKSYIFIVFEIALALDSLSVPKSVWAVFNPSLADLGMESLGVDNPGSASVMESPKASYPNVDSE
ncbi:hypothetical protein Tco_0945941 [Tanacetum coccineum]